MDQRMLLNFNDIADAVKVIDYCAKKGLLSGWDEIRPVLALRDKLQAFVDAAQEAIAKKNEAMNAPVEEEVTNGDS